jgi:hypothetical protein
MCNKLGTGLRSTAKILLVPIIAQSPRPLGQNVTVPSHKGRKPASVKPLTTRLRMANLLGFFQERIKIKFGHTLYVIDLKFL